MANFSKRKPGAVVAMPEGKERITIRLDSDIVNWFRDAVEKAGGENYFVVPELASRWT